MCFKIYFDIYLIIVIYFMNFINFDFIFNFFLFQRKKICTLKLIAALNVWLLRHGIWFQSFFPSFFKADLHSTWVAQLVQFASKWFFQSPFQENKMFCLPNKFVVFTNHKQPLKCVQQNSYLHLWSNTLHIIWKGVHLLVKLQATGTNK